MTQAPSIQNTAVAGLLRLLEESGETQCAELRARAAEKIGAIKRQAYAQARQRVRNAVAEERARIKQEVGRVEAEVASDLRRRGLRHDARLVESGRELLAQVLRRRWEDPEARQAWLGQTLEVCQRVVMGRDWVMRCPPHWPEDERRQAVALAEKQAGVALEIKDDADLAEGFQVQCRGVVVDLTVPGLLADQAAIEGALLQINRLLTRGDEE